MCDLGGMDLGYDRCLKSVQSAGHIIFYSTCIHRGVFLAKFDLGRNQEGINR